MRQVDQGRRNGQVTMLRSYNRGDLMPTRQDIAAADDATDEVIEAAVQEAMLRSPPRPGCGKETSGARRRAFKDGFSSDSNSAGPRARRCYPRLLDTCSRR